MAVQLPNLAALDERAIVPTDGIPKSREVYSLSLFFFNDNLRTIEVVDPPATKLFNKPGYFDGYLTRVFNGAENGKKMTYTDEKNKLPTAADVVRLLNKLRGPVLLEKKMEFSVTTDRSIKLQ